MLKGRELADEPALQFRQRRTDFLLLFVEVHKLLLHGLPQFAESRSSDRIADRDKNLAAGFDQRTHSLLIRSNWTRVAAWPAAAAIALWMCHQVFMP